MPSQDNAAPTATMRIVLWPTRGDADFTRTVLEDPLADATHEERINFAAQYADLSLLELWRRLRWAEWNAEHYRTEYERMQEYQKRYPPLYRIQEMDARHKRVRALLDVPRRRSIPKAELLAALNDPVERPVKSTPKPDPTAT
ncbi:MAG: hypothetical protein JWO98_1434 [Frankiales bacterium]|nr:hypothetical protein [Frankiales bacterium]